MTYRSYSHRWLVVCDDERKSYHSRSAARYAAAALNGHPANANIRRFGPYANARGAARVIDLGYPNSVDGRYYLDVDEA